MAGGKSLEERLVDRLLLLHLVDYLDKVGASVHETKLQKLVFLAERELLGNRIKGFNYNFVRLDFGPFSWELRKDVQKLLESNMLKDDPSRGYILTDKARRILSRFRRFRKEYADVLEFLEKTAEKYGKMPLTDLLAYVYGLSRPLKGPKVPIGELKHRTPILRRMSVKRAIKVVKLSEDEYELLAVLTDPELEEVFVRYLNGREILLFRLKGDTGYTAVPLGLLGCVSQGEDLEEALKNVKEAIKCYLEG